MSAAELRFLFIKQIISSKSNKTEVYSAAA